MGHAILSRSACFNDKLLQHNIRNVRFAQTRSNDIKFLFLSARGETRNRFPNSVSAIVYAEGTCARTSREGTTKLPVASLPGKTSCNFGTRFLGPLVIWIGEPVWWRWCYKTGCQLYREDHLP